MSQRPLNAELLKSEFVFATSRSSGPGGQNVNKVNSKVTLHFNMSTSAILTDDEKLMLRRKLASKITNEGVLIVSSQSKRSQLLNKEEVLRKFDSMLEKALFKQKKRKATKATVSSVNKRISKKKLHSEKKKFRRKPFD